MKWLASELNGYAIEATDGDVGSVVDVLLDDRDWTVRWVVVDTGTWLAGRQVVVPPANLGKPDDVHRVIRAGLTRDTVESSPALDTAAPVSRQMETTLTDYYGGVPYWAGGVGYPIGVPAGVPHPVLADEMAARGNAGRTLDNPSLRSAGFVTGCTIRASDGDIGHVEDFLIDDETWAVRYMIVDTVNWWPGRKVLIAPRWIDAVSWADQAVSVGLTREAVRTSPEWEPVTKPGRDYEERLHHHYGYAPYWV